MGQKSDNVRHEKCVNTSPRTSLLYPLTELPTIERGSSIRFKASNARDCESRGHKEKHVAKLKISMQSQQKKDTNRGTFSNVEDGSADHTECF